MNATTTTDRRKRGATQTQSVRGRVAVCVIGETATNSATTNGESQPVGAGLPVSFSVRGLMEMVAAFVTWRDDARRMIRESLRYTESGQDRHRHLLAARDAAACAREWYAHLRGELGCDPRKLGHLEMARMLNAGGAA